MTRILLYPLCCAAAVLAGVSATVAAPANPENHSIICMEMDRGLVLYEENADVVRPPASMIKLMLMLLVTEGYERGDWVPETMIPVTERAQGMGGTQVQLKVGEEWPLGKMMQAVAVASANDAAMAVAEGLWGSAEAYLKVANERAKTLGMSHTVIRGVHGLPPSDRKSFDETTARDMAQLALACIQKDQIMALVRQKELQFRPDEPVKSNTNKLLWRMADCDGLKTGFINAAGFCVAATAQRNGRRLVCVIMGSQSKYGRFQLAEDLFNRFLDDYAEITLIGKGAPLGVDVPVYHGKVETASVCAGGDVSILLPRNLMSEVEVSAIHPEKLEAPLSPMSVVGELTVSLNNTTLTTVPLLVSDEVESDGWYLSIRDGVAQWKGLENMTGVAASSEGESPEE
ncbi:MAG: D-alanyl-D-alanine carboxypeptidase [Candidatus Hydrogenedentes bacterium]|nr:D-alanyl-D-alanine carboxypeptidase [Candidatus Hydrogenedentota bacterium]